MPDRTPPIVCFDAEASHLHGFAFAAGGVVLAPDGEVAATFFALAEVPEDALSPWVRENVLPALAAERPTHPDLASMRAAFWAWLAVRPEGALVVVDCGWPVEANLLQACVDDSPARRMRGPSPLHEAATLLLAAGVDGSDEGRRACLGDARWGPLRPHHPVDDALASARLVREALLRLRR